VSTPCTAPAWVPTASPTKCGCAWPVRSENRAQAERIGQEVEALYLNGPAGGGGVTMSVREVIAVASALIPRDAVQTECRILEL
jgi:hypothetical protein